MSTNVHKTPLRKMVVFDFKIAAVKAVQNILSPWNEEPYNSTKLVRSGLENYFWFCSAKENGFTSRNQRTEPVHFCTCVVKRRNTKENIILCLAVVLLFYGSPYVQGLVEALGVSNPLAFVVAVVGVQAIVEWAACCVVAAAVTVPLRKYLKMN